MDIRLDSVKIFRLFKEFNKKDDLRINFPENIKNHFIKNLLFEIESYKTGFREYTIFLIDFYKYSNKKEAIDYFNKFKKEKNSKEVTNKLKDYSKKLNIAYKFKSFIENFDESRYIDSKSISKNKNIYKTIFLIYDYIIIIYYFNEFDSNDIYYSLDIFNVINDYLKSLKK